jgi:hypothetical protein
MKRVLSILAAAVLCLMMLTACANDTMGRSDWDNVSTTDNGYVNGTGYATGNGANGTTQNGTGYGTNGANTTRGAYNGTTTVNPAR